MRRSCEVRLRRTNTPLHALTLLNDTTALEAARTLAENGLPQNGLNDSRCDPMERLRQMFQTVLSRQPTDNEKRVLKREYEHAKQYYDTNRGDAQSLATVGQLLTPTGEQASDLAAEMLIASMILNMDESITHE